MEAQDGAFPPSINSITEHSIKIDAEIKTTGHTHLTTVGRVSKSMPTVTCFYRIKLPPLRQTDTHLYFKSGNIPQTEGGQSVSHLPNIPMISKTLD